LGYDTKDRKKVVYIVDGRGSTEVWNEGQASNSTFDSRLDEADREAIPVGLYKLTD
jgi:hypothetical protein